MIIILLVHPNHISIQIERAEMRLKVLHLFLSLMQKETLLPSVKLAILHAWLNLLIFCPVRE